MHRSLLPEYLCKLDQVRKELSNINSPQLQSKKVKDSLRGLVEEYFRDIRASIVGAESNAPDIDMVDGLMQDLIVLCHKNGTIKRYKDLLSRAKKGMALLDARVISAPTMVGSSSPNNSTDQVIIDTLNKIVPSAALSYQQALDDLRVATRLSWRGPATDLREALRETLDHLAPDKSVVSAQGYKQEPNTNGPTMKQKVIFILKSRDITGAKASPAENATVAIESAIGTFIRSVYTRSSVSTHTPTDKAEVIRIRDLVRVVLCELLEISS